MSTRGRTWQQLNRITSQPLVGLTPGSFLRLYTIMFVSFLEGCLYSIVMNIFPMNRLLCVYVVS